MRYNSQSGKGGAAFIMENVFGYELPKRMHPEFGALAKAESDRLGKELSPSDLMEVFNKNYIDIEQKVWLVKHVIRNIGENEATFTGTIHLVKADKDVDIYGEGNGPIDALTNALRSVGVIGFEIEKYKEHSISQGSDSKAICYMQVKDPDGRTVFGVGISHGIFKASARSLFCAINRSDCEVRVNGELI